MKLLYDENDLLHAAKLRDKRFTWLEELGASQLAGSTLDDAGFLFGYDDGDEHYRRLVENRPNVRDRPEERQELTRLDHVLQRLHDSRIDVPTPRTWILNVDEPAPDDLAFPVFVRTAKSSWKRGGGQSRANSLAQLNEEIELLRRERSNADD